MRSLTIRTSSLTVESVWEEPDIYTWESLVPVRTGRYEAQIFDAETGNGFLIGSQALGGDERYFEVYRVREFFLGDLYGFA